MTDVLRIAAVLVLIAGNAFFVIGEYSIVTARRAGLVALAGPAGRARAGARSALRLMDDPVRVISAAQIGITAIGILTGALGEPAVHRVLGDAMPRWLGFVVAFGLVAYVSVVLGELVPKALTLQRAEACAVVVARPMELLAKALTPLIVVLQASALVVLRPLGVREIVIGRGVRSAAELRTMVADAEDTGVIPRSQEELLHNVLDFAERTARDAMIPVDAVVWLDAGSSVASAIDTALRSPHTRYPVRGGRMSPGLGVVHVRDLVRATRGLLAATTVVDLAREAVVVPGDLRLARVLRQLRARHQHLAIVTDERGDPTGILTMEDVVEEIVGDIEDEFDPPGSEADPRRSGPTATEDARP